MLSKLLCCLWKCLFILVSMCIFRIKAEPDCITIKRIGFECVLFYNNFYIIKLRGWESFWFDTKKNYVVCLDFVQCPFFSVAKLFFVLSNCICVLKHQNLGRKNRKKVCAGNPKHMSISHGVLKVFFNNFSNFNFHTNCFV